MPKKGSKKATRKKVMTTDPDMEQRRQQFFKDTLKEDERSTLGLAVNQNWRTLFRQSKTEEQRRSTEEMKNSMEKQLDGVDHNKELSEELLEREERLAKEMDQSFLELVSQIEDIQKKHLAWKKQNWKRIMSHFKERHRLNVTETSSEDMFKSLTLEDPLSIHEALDKKLFKEILSKIGSLVDEHVEKFHFKRKMMLEEMSEKYREAIHKEKQKIAMAQAVVDEATSDQQRLREGLDKGANELQKLEENLNTLQSKRLTQEMELAKVKEQQVRIESQNQKLRDQVERGRNSARKSLIRLSMQSD